jgi:hypothetical protein
MTKKIWLSLGMSGVMFFLAGQALAAAYAPGTMMNNTQSGTTITGTMPNAQVWQQDSQQLQAYKNKLVQGTLTPQDQMAMYQLLESMNSMNIAGGASLNNVAYTSLPTQLTGGSMMASYANERVVWMGLVSIITTILIWIVLIQLIFVLYHWLKKHKH